MVIPHIVSLISNTIWLFVPFRQAKTNYFFFFLIYAVTSAFMLLDYILLLHPAKFYLGQGFFLIISLYNFQKIPYYVSVLLSILIISIILAVIIPVKIIIPCLIAEHVVIFFIILKRTVLYSNEHKKLNIFHFVLLLFEITAITRFIVVLKNLRTGIIFFYLTTAFGILIGIFFLLYNEKNSPKISLESKGIVNMD